MKKILLTVMVILIAVFFVTCDEPIVDDDAIVEYTDVVYSPDGSQVTVYLDGVTVPVTKAQRAMNRDLAMMSYDFLEVIFVSSVTTTNIARANWELGQPAGLYGVYRDATNYASIANACLFAGKKSDKTLFGIGKIAGTTLVLTSNTPSVTFEISAILSGLLLNGETGPTTPGLPNTRGVAYDSLGAAEGRVNLGGVDYPLFQVEGSPVTKNYKFGIVRNNTANFDAAKLIGPNDPPVAQRRTPRFMDGGSYREPKTLVNSKTLVSIPAATAGQDFSSYCPATGIEITFTTTATGATGYFSLYMEIPVYNTNNTVFDLDAAGTPKDKGWTNPIKWFIRSGYGSELYSIDDGTSSGGCVLFGRGTTGGSDWLDIEWRWLPYTTTP